MLIGVTDQGRMLSIVLDPEGDDVFYVVTARPSSAKERSLHRGPTRGENE